MNKKAEKSFLSKFNSKLNKEIIKLPNYFVSQPKYKKDFEGDEEFNDICDQYLKGYKNLELITDVLNAQSEVKKTNSRQNGRKSTMHTVTNFVANVLA